MGRRLGISLAAAAATLLAAGLLLTALALALSQGWQRERLRALVASGLGDALGVEVTLASLEGPLYPELVLGGVRIGPAQAPLLTVERASVRLDALPWLRERRLVLEQLEFEGVEGALEWRDDGGWLGVPGPEDAAGGSVLGGAWLRGLELRDVALERARLRLAWPAGEERVEIALGIEARAAGLRFPWRPEAASEVSGQLHLALEPGRIGAVGLEEGSVSASVAGGRLVIESGRLSGPLGRLALAGTADLLGERIERVELAGELPRLQRLPSGWVDGLEGTLRLRLEAAGDFADPTGWLELDASGLRLDGQLLGELSTRLATPGGGVVRIERLSLREGLLPLETDGVAQLRVEPGAVHVETLALASGAQHLRLSGTLYPDGLAPGSQARAFDAVAVEARALEVARLAPLLPADRRPGGVLDATLHGGGPWRAPDLEGTLVWRAPRLGDASLERIEATVSAGAGQGAVAFEGYQGGRALARGRAELRLATLASPEGILADPATAIALEAEGLDLALLAPWLPRVVREPEGRADVALQLRGAEPEPQLEGSIAVADGALRMPLLRQRFAPIRGRIALSNREITLEDWRIGSPGAEARIAGRIALAGGRPGALDLALQLEAFPLSRAPVLETDVAGELRVGGTLEALAVEGSLALAGTRISLGDAAEPALREIRVIQEDTARAGSGGLRIEERPVAPGFWDRARIDVSLSVPVGTWVRGRDLQIELEGDLAFRKQPLQEPTIVGRTEAVRGRYSFQRKRFQIRRGVVTFDGGIPVDPLLDVEALHRVADVTVFLGATGRASAPVVRLWSEPPLPESDVLAYLLFGKPVDQLSAGQRMGVGNAAGRFASGLVASEAEMVLEDLLPVDSVEIRIAEDGTPEEVGVGSYVTDRVYLRFGHSLGTGARPLAGAEYRINRNWSLEGDLAGNESAGADVIFTFEY